MPMPAIVLAVNGTLIDDEARRAEPQKRRLRTTAVAALQLWHTADYRIVALGNEVETAERGAQASGSNNERELRVLFDDIGIPLAGYHSCPPRVALADVGGWRDDCHAPAAGLITRAMELLGVSPALCWVVGNALDYVEAGSRAGCTTVLLYNGGEREWRLTPWRIPDYLAHDLLEAAQVVIATEEAALRVVDAATMKPADGSVYRVDETTRASRINN